jgi:hypothetical protein
MKMNSVVHFELPYENRDRAEVFYGKVFGWKLQKFGPEMGNYMTAQTDEMDEHDKPVHPGTIGGGFFQKSAGANLPTVVIAVDDIQAAMKSIVAAGGKVLGGEKPGVPDDIPGIGLYIAFTDTEGNRIAILEPKKMM